MTLKKIIGAVLTSLTMSAVYAETWPAKPITFIVPFPAAGGTDAFARPLAAQLSKQLGAQIIIDNRGGAGGTLGASIAAKAAPDGYTYLIGAVHHAIAPSIYPKLDYNIQKDFVPISIVATPPQVVVVNPQKMPVNDLNGFVEQVKKNPGKLNFGSAGNGTSSHIAGELFKQQTKTLITHVPYRGAGPALQDLIGGRLDLMFDGLGASASHIRSGRIKALAVAADKRAPGFPDIPTAAEAGLPGFLVSTWYGMFAPKGTPPDIAQRMRDELQKAFSSPEIIKAWENNGSEMPQASKEELTKLLEAELQRWEKVVRTSGVRLD